MDTDVDLGRTGNVRARRESRPPGQPSKCGDFGELSRAVRNAEPFKRGVRNAECGIGEKARGVGREGDQ